MELILLLAQNTQASPAGVAALVLGFLVLMLIPIAVSLVVAAIVCFIISGVVEAIPEAHRRIRPGQVWLLLIPFFNLIWNFRVFLDVPDSLRSAFAAAGRHDVGDCGRNLGMWYAGLVVGATIGPAIPVVGCVTPVLGLVALVMLVLFLVKAVDLKSQLIAARSAGAAAPAPPTAE